MGMRLAGLGWRRRFDWRADWIDAKDMARFDWRAEWIDAKDMADDRIQRRLGLGRRLRLQPNAIARKRNDGSNVRHQHKPGQNLSLLSTYQSP
jgi:hypothetical protein